LSSLVLLFLLGCRSEANSPATPKDAKVSMPSGGSSQDAATLDGSRPSPVRDAAAPDPSATDASAPVGCAPVPQGSDGPPSGLIFCEDGTHLVEELPSRCERIGVDWTTWDSGQPVPCEPHIAHWCSSKMCDPVDGRCVRLSECTEDDDCDDGEACVCSGPVWHQYPRCLPVGCRTSADCSSGSCGLSSDACGFAEQTRCHTQGDECHFNADCDVNQSCRYIDSVGLWRCDERISCE
jgi:hypothetical protein